MSPEEQKALPIMEGLFRTPPDAPPHLIGSQCRGCGYISFPKRAICPACLGDDTMEEIPLSRRGRLDTFTVCWVAPPCFTAPYIQAFITLPEGPRIFSIIAGAEEDLELGGEVELVIEKVAQDERGNDLIGYKFRPLKG